MRFFLCWGFGIWFVASAVFRFIGHYFFTLKEPLLMIATYILAFPIVWLATIPIYSIKKYKVQSDYWLQSASHYLECLSMQSFY